MAKQTAALKTHGETLRRHRRHDRVSISLRLRARSKLRVVPKVRQGCEVTVLWCRDDQRFEIHREVTAAGRLRWFAVEIRGEHVHEARSSQRRWEAVEICHGWIARGD